MAAGYHLPVLPVLCAGALALGSCGATGPGDPANRQASLKDAAEGSERVSDRHFSRHTVPCRGPAEATARALLELTDRNLSEDTRTRLLDHATEDVQLRDGDGMIAVIVYALSPEDEESTITRTEHFLINSSCRVMTWRSAATPPD